MSRLRKVERHFLRAQQIDFPYAVKVIGPFETGMDALEEMARIRDAKELPGCNVTKFSKRVPLAEAHPIERTNP